MRRFAILSATIGAAALLAGCGGQGEQAPASGERPAAAPAELTDEERQARLAALPAPYNQADLENGRRKFGLCRSCHTIVPGGANMTGPNLHGLFGRQAGAVDGYRYSEALLQADFAWTPERLDDWLENPRTFLPGNKMSFMGIKDPKDRTDLIAYLMVETGATGAPAAGEDAAVTQP